MAARRGAGDEPWYRTTAATFAAGGFGAVLVGALVVTVVQMSDQWSTPTTTLVTTPAATPLPAPSTSRPGQLPFVITPSDASTTFTTSVPLSTTDIGIPPVNPTDTATTTSSSAESGTSTTTTTTSVSEEPDEEPTTTRKRPRYNETRTYSPGH